MKKIKVCILAHYSPHSKRSGSVIDIEKIIEYLSYRDDIELHVVTFGDKNTQFKKGNLNIYVLKGIKPNILRLFLIPRLRRKITEIDPDIVHAKITSIPYSTATAFIRNKPAVLTILGLKAKEAKYAEGIIPFILTSINRLNERYVIFKIPNIIIITPSIKNLISKWTKSKIYIVQDGIEFEEIQGFQPHKSEKPDVLFISHLTKLKGVDILIKAIPMVLNSVPDLSVYIAGDGPQKDELKKMVKELNLEAHVKFLGYISGEEEKYSYYKACKVVVAPSRWDCQPYAVTEGAACGKPIIASDKSNPALLDDGKIGFVFQSENAEDLANKIIKLLKDDKLRAEMGKAGMEKVKDYDWSKIADRQVEIYKEVIADFHERKGKSKNKRKNRNRKHL